MAQFDSHKWTREFKEAQVAQASREVDLGEDYSTMRLQSNIAQKWHDSEDMKNDLRQWVEASMQSGGYDLLDDIVSALEVEVRLYKIYRKKMQR